jgi:perosamine synthetase
MGALRAIGARHNIPVIEDAAEAIGSKWQGKRAGSMGVFGTFSFHGSKTMTTGEGGMFVTNDDDLYEKVLTLSNHGRVKGQAKQFWCDMIGFKYKMSNVEAAIGCAQLERIEELISDKREVFKYYEKNLKDLPLKMNPEPVGTINGFWLPNIMVDEDVAFDRGAVLDEFIRGKIDARVFFWPLSMQPMFEDIPENVVSYDIYKRGINLPSYYGLTKLDMDRVINKVRKHFESFKSR